MRLRIGIRAILGVALVTAGVVGAESVVVVRAHQAALRAQLTQSADQLSETIVSSTYWDMLENRRPAVHREMLTIGRQKGIEKVRLFNGTGRIMFSSDEREIGATLDSKAEACTACHAAGEPLRRLDMRERARVYAAPDGHRVLGMIRPIHNEARCWNAPCHAHRPDEAVLGVLDVNVSMAEADARTAADRRSMFALAALTIVASSLLLWALNERLVVRPVARLIAGTRKVAEGDLTTTLPAAGGHELGDLARSFNDMTRRLADAQRQLTQADKLAAVGRLAAGVAHEINNPLTGVLTYASFLLKRAKDSPETVADLEVIVRETRRCRDIVRGLLDFSRQTPPKREPVDLSDITRRGVAVIVHQLGLRHVALDFELAAGLPAVHADASQIQQVVVNLVMNAADALGEGGGTIHVRTRATRSVARGRAVLRTVHCPHGCDLLDAGVRIGRHPAIRVIRRERERDVVVHLDPVYGGANHQASEPLEDGTLAGYACPRCRARLDTPERRCADCGAPAFAVRLGDRGAIEWCTRKGCHWTRCGALDAEGLRDVVELEVEDTGHGIAPADLDHLFEPFFTTKGNRGLGLGLAVTWGIVEGHGGSIEVRSEPGRGACFGVRLPCAPAAPAPEPAPAQPVAAGVGS